MARTRRHTLEGTTSDGKIGLLTIVAHNHRAVGFSDHRRDRREARIHLHTGNVDAVLCGKRRKYSNHFDYCRC